MCSGSRGASPPEHLPKHPPFPWWSSSCREAPRLLFKGPLPAEAKVSTEPRVLCSILRPGEGAGRLIQHGCPGKWGHFSSRELGLHSATEPSSCLSQPRPLQLRDSSSHSVSSYSSGPTWILFTSFPVCPGLSSASSSPKEGSPIGASSASLRRLQFVESAVMLLCGPW